MIGLPTRHIRILVQWSVFLIWVALLWATHHPMDAWIAKKIPVSLLLRIDPLVMTVVCGGMRMGIQILMLGFVTMGISILLGRVFCGWVCPLGATFDFYGWILRKLNAKFEGPSPSWYRLKFYLLLAILLFAAIGGVSPLMGFDPLVLITRTAAVVLFPFARKHQEFTWTVGSPPGFYGYFIDMASLALFGAIMYGTTKLSRIWCRTTCPLGAYLGLLGRNAILRRDTQGCVHCNICSRHCPTGAIDYENAEVYTESECIKCFACSQECPVDANFFTIKSPFPAVTRSQKPVSLERRQLLTTAAFTMLAAPALNLHAGETKSGKRLLRPPMSREEHDFLSSCIRCAECMKACPTGVLKPAGLQHGLRAMWSPVLVPTEGFCLEGCNACSQACPTDAITKYDITNKYKYKIGTAVLESGRCISYTENKFCSECVRACPTDAIQVKKGWEPPGASLKHLPPGQASVATGASEKPAPEGQVPTRPFHVNFDRCVGCGACEYQCNQIVMGEPAMVTTTFGRAIATQLDKKD